MFEITDVEPAGSGAGASTRLSELLLESELYGEQRKRLGRHPLDDAVVASIIDLADERSGRVHRDVLAARLQLAPAAFDRTAPGETRSVAQANVTRPILPVNGGVRQINVLTNLGESDYHALQTQITYRRSARMYAALSYTLSSATNTTERTTRPHTQRSRVVAVAWISVSWSSDMMVIWPKSSGTRSPRASLN